MVGDEPDAHARERTRALRDQDIDAGEHVRGPGRIAARAGIRGVRPGPRRTGGKRANTSRDEELRHETSTTSVRFHSRSLSMMDKSSNSRDLYVSGNRREMSAAAVPSAPAARRSRSTARGLLLLLVFLGCAPLGGRRAQPAPGTPEAEAAWVDGTLARMSLRRKVAQLN